jgi:phosphatidylethanolamine-binding protein (PEBP) family uncharacterized protein
MLENEETRMRSFASVAALAAAMMVAAPAFAQSPPPEVEAGKDLMAITTLPARDGATLTVLSAGWPNGGDIAFKYTQYEGNEFPGLHWTSGPAGTKSYAIIMQDTDLVMRGSPILHWSVVNIPASVDHLPAGMKPEEIPAGSIYGPNYQGAGKPYLGPRTPSGAEASLSHPGLRAGYECCPLTSRRRPMPS